MLENCMDPQNKNVFQEHTIIVIAFGKGECLLIWGVCDLLDVLWMQAKLFPYKEFSSLIHVPFHCHFVLCHFLCI